MRLAPVVAACLLAGSLAAHADVYVPFTLSGTETIAAYNDGFTFAFSSTYPISGFGEYDDIDGGSLSLILDTGLLSPIGAYTGGFFYIVNGRLVPSDPFSGGMVSFDYNPNGLSSGLFSYSQALFGTDYDPATDQFSDGLIEVSATGVLTQVTPEPSSLALLGTGVLGAAAVLRRKRAQSLSCSSSLRL